MSTLYADGAYLRERKSKCYVAAFHEGAAPYKAALIAAPETLAELKKLHAICLAMDGEVPGDRPTEEEYMAAIQSSAKAIFRAEQS